MIINKIFFIINYKLFNYAEIERNAYLSWHLFDVETHVVALPPLVIMCHTYEEGNCRQYEIDR